jgi:hypothetical protein
MNATPGAPPACLRLSSELPDVSRATLEELLFFNPGQHRAVEAIVESIACHGKPEIRCEAGMLHIHVGELGRAQTLYVFDHADQLVAAIVFSRISYDEIVVLHVAVSEQFSSTGAMAHTAVVLRLFQAVREVAARLRGVKSIQMYHPGGPVWYPVSTRAAAPAQGRK